MKLRWCEHRTHLRRGTHHCFRLQKAWNKYGEAGAKFSVVEECAADALLSLEKEAMNAVPVRKLMNTAKDPSNVWLTMETRERFAAIHSTPEWKAERSRIAKEVGARRAVAVDCSNGQRYASLREAADQFGVKPSGIAHLVKTQKAGRLGVAFKLAAEEWRGPQEPKERRGWSAESRLRKSIACRGKKPSAKAIKKSLEVNRVDVVGEHVITGEVVRFVSMRDAARFVRPENFMTAGAQICKACAGVKKSAYGYIWARGQKKEAGHAAA